MMCKSGTATGNQAIGQNVLNHVLRLLTVVLMVVLLSSLPVARADTQRLLILTDETASENSAAMTAVLRKIALYSSWDCTFQDSLTVEDTEGYTAVILCLDAGHQLAEETATLLKRSELPIFLLGQGGVSAMTETMTLEGTLTLRLTTQANASSDEILPMTRLKLMQGEGESLGGEIYLGNTAYPLCQRVGNLTQLAYFDPTQETQCAALATLLETWLWPYENAPTSYGNYLVLDMVYPFTDPAALLERIDMLEEENVPYSICVMPIYSNADYPAMKRFCEVLAYAQSRGAAILLRVPLVTLQSTTVEDLKANIATAYSAYSRYGVYPLAIEAPDVWLMSESGLEALRGWRTVFLFTSDEPVYGALLGENAALRDGHQLIAPAYSRSDAYTSAYAQAIYLDVSADVETLRTQVQRLKNSRYVLKNVREMEAAVYAGNIYISWHPDNGMVVDGTPVSLTYTRFTYDENYVYDRGFVQNMVKQIQSSNQLIMIFVVVACAFFITGMALSRRDTRHQLLGNPREGHHGEKQDGENRREGVNVDDAG